MLQHVTSRLFPVGQHIISGHGVTAHVVGRGPGSVTLLVDGMGKWCAVTRSVKQMRHEWRALGEG